MVKENRAFPGWKTRQAHVDYIMANWNELAKTAYRGFLAHGAGMVVLDESDFLGKPIGVLTQVSVGYLPKDSPKLAGLIEKKERAWLAEYDPSNTILFLMIRHQDVGTSTYRMTGIDPNRTPRALHERDIA